MSKVDQTDLVYTVGSDTQAVTAVTTASLTFEIIDDTFGF